MRHTAHLKLIPLLLFTLLLSSCGKEYLNDFENNIEPTAFELPEFPATNTNQSISSTQPTEPTSQTSPAEEEEDRQNGKSLPMMNVPTFGYYSIPDNSQPLFSKSCLIVENPETCSSEMLGRWLNEQIKNEESGLEKGEFSIQYIFFELDEKGKIFNIQHAGSDGNTLCWPCLNTAMKTIAKMPDWSPAVKDGVPYNTSIKIPIRFELI
ncbi:MAG: energy transducer TonB [Bacteroidota bacterium]